MDGAKPVRQSAIRVVWLMASVYYALVLFRRCGLANGTKRASRTRQFEYGARKRARERYNSGLILILNYTTRGSLRWGRVREL